MRILHGYGLSQFFQCLLTSEDSKLAQRTLSVALLENNTDHPKLKTIIINVTLRVRPKIPPQSRISTVECFFYSYQIICSLTWQHFRSAQPSLDLLIPYLIIFQTKSKCRKKFAETTVFKKWSHVLKTTMITILISS